MRLDTTLFITDNESASKEARYVISIDFDGTVQYFTSHDDIANVPSPPTPIDNVVFGISATSQTLNPDRANATIGSMSFDLLDLNSSITDLIRDELDTNDVGLRDRTVQFFIGYLSTQPGALILDGSSTDDNPDFDAFVLFQTQIIRNVETKEGKYSFRCADIQRNTKRQIFDLALTYLTSSITDTDTTIPVLDLSGFEGNNHGTSYTDAPSSNVIYFRIDQTKEIIRAPVSGISGNSFTGVTRGALLTKQIAVEVDQTLPSDRRPQVEEYVYIELPAVKLAYAILTGDIDGTADVLPTSWHAGVDTSFVRLTDFQNIGVDLWDTTDDNTGVVLLFSGIEKQDAKKFLETEIYLLLGLFSPVYADGQLGLKRMVPSLADSPFSFELDDDNVISTGNLLHDMESMQNNLRIDWNWNGERFIRSNIIVDSASIARHGQAPEKRLGFRGLVGARFTEQVLRQLLTSLRDMYNGPPLRLDANCYHLFNRVEVGDAARVNLLNLRDYSATPTNLQRTMVVHGMTVDWLKGVKFKLFGSSDRADEIPPVTATECLPDAFYPSQGTALNSIGGLMTGNATNAGTFTLSGDADLTAAGAIFYHDADLTISSGTTLIIEENVQLRVKGFITINGTIDGTGEGLPTDANLFVSGEHYYFLTGNQLGTPGFIGNSQSHHGLIYRTSEIPSWVWVTAGYFTEGLFQAFPNLILEVDDAGSGSIIGLPTDMRGGGGAHGPRAGEKLGLTGFARQRASGGAGGSGGAGLCIICRGGDFGVAGQITLDGDDGVEPVTFFAADEFEIFGGAGGAGAPGALLWLLDGSSVTFPDIAGHFSALTGEVNAAFALPFLANAYLQNRNLREVSAPQKNMAPFMPDRISAFDQSGANFRISFLPCDVVPEDDQDNLVPPPTNGAASTVPDGVEVTWTDPAGNQFKHIEIHASEENDRTTSNVVGTSPNSPFKELLIDFARQRFYWLRAVNDAGAVSDFEPDAIPTSITAYPGAPSSNLLNDPDFDLSTSIPLMDLSFPFPTQFHDFPWAGEVIDANTPVTTRVTELQFNSAAGVAGSNAIKFIKGDPSVSPKRSTIRLISTRRIRANSHRFRIEIRYRNQGGIDFGEVSAGDSVSIFMRGHTDETGGSQPGFGQPLGNGNLIFAVTGATWTTKVFITESGVSPEDARFWAFDFIATDVNSNLAEMEIDSIFIFALDPEMVGSTGSVDGKTGLVPSPTIAETAKFLKGDGTWDDPDPGVVDFGDVGDIDVTGASQGDFLYFNDPDWTKTALIRQVTENSNDKIRITALGISTDKDASLELISNFPTLLFERSDAATNQRAWRMGIVDTGGRFLFEIRSSSGSGASKWFEALRTGTQIERTIFYLGPNEKAIVMNRNADIELYHNGIEMARTALAASGGFEINNTVTGAGFERALTIADRKSANIYLRDSTVVEDRTLNASAAATTINNNNVLAALIADLQSADVVQ